jgi:hypothetical protein
MPTFPRWGKTLATIALLTVAAAADAADPAIASNLTSNLNGYLGFSVGVTGRALQKFTLGSTWNVTSFEALLGAASSRTQSPILQAKLYNDNAGIVGTDTGVVFTQVGAITGATTLANYQTVAFDPTAALTLGPGSYWFGLDVTNLNQSFRWAVAFSGSQVQSGIAGNTIDNDRAIGNNSAYGYDSVVPQMMSVNGVAAVPEPGTVATVLVFGGGLGALVLKGRRRNA